MHNHAIEKSARPDYGAAQSDNSRVADRSGAIEQITIQNPGTLPSDSAKLIRHFSDAGLRTGLLLRPSHRGSTQTDAADGVLADFDRDAAG